MQSAVITKPPGCAQECTRARSHHCMPVHSCVSSCKSTCTSVVHCTWQTRATRATYISTGCNALTLLLSTPSSGAVEAIAAWSIRQASAARAQPLPQPIAAKARVGTGAYAAPKSPSHELEGLTITDSISWSSTCAYTCTRPSRVDEPANLQAVGVRKRTARQGKQASSIRLLSTTLTTTTGSTRGSRRSVPCCSWLEPHRSRPSEAHRVLSRTPHWQNRARSAGPVASVSDSPSS
jgi:hypothetical protein